MNKEEILIAIKEIQCRYSLPALERNFTDKDYACRQYEKLIIHLANQQEQKNQEIERLNKLLSIEKDYRERFDKDNQRLHSIIKEVRELVENGTDFKSIYFKKDKEDLWKVILANEIKEKYLEILDKINKE